MLIAYERGAGLRAGRPGAHRVRAWCRANFQALHHAHGPATVLADKDDYSSRSTAPGQSARSWLVMHRYCARPAKRDAPGGVGPGGQEQQSSRSRAAHQRSRAAAAEQQQRGGPSSSSSNSSSSSGGRQDTQQGGSGKAAARAAARPATSAERQVRRARAVYADRAARRAVSSSPSYCAAGSSHESCRWPWVRAPGQYDNCAGRGPSTRTARRDAL